MIKPLFNAANHIGSRAYRTATSKAHPEKAEGDRQTFGDTVCDFTGDVFGTVGKVFVDNPIKSASASAGALVGWQAASHIGVLAYGLLGAAGAAVGGGIGYGLGWSANQFCRLPGMEKFEGRELSWAKKGAAVGLGVGIFSGAMGATDLVTGACVIGAGAIGWAAPAMLKKIGLATTNGAKELAVSQYNQMAGKEPKDLTQV